MAQKDKDIDEKKAFEITFDDDETVKAKAEAENRGEIVKDEPVKKVEEITKDEEKEEEKSTEQEKSEETKKEDIKAPAEEESKKEVVKNNFPKKNEGESDAAYNIRMQLKIAQESRDDAPTAEEKSVYEKRMDDLRKNLSEVNKEEKSKKTEEKPEEEKSTADLEEDLKTKGFVKAEDVDKIFKERLNDLRKNEIIEGHENAIKRFYKERPEFLQNKDARNFLESYVVNLIKPDLNTTPQQLFDALKLVSDAKFPKANRSEDARRSQDKVDLMNIEGNSKGTQKKASVGDKEGDMLRSMGWSDEQISTFG